MSIPKTLEDRLRDKKVIPFVGAGVSMAVRHRDTGERLFPNWDALLRRAADRLEEEVKSPYAGLVRNHLDIDAKDYLAAAKHARDGLGGVWYDFLNEQLDHSREDVDDESLALAQAVWKLGSNLIITTNYDRVLRWACSRQDNLSTWDIQAPAEQSRTLREGARHPTIWHLHGHIGNAADLILTPDGYERLYPEKEGFKNRYEAALETLRSLLASRTFLFVGFSLDDVHFGMQLQGIDQIFQGSTGPHYVLVHEAERDRVRALNLPVEIVTFSDFGEPLLNLLDELGEIASASTTDETTPPETPTETPKIASYDPRKPVFFVPFRPKKKQVIGREKALQQVRKQLTEGLRTHIGQVAAFLGLGGLGKTQLAVEYAYEHRNEYPNGVIWLTADQDIDAQLTDLAEKAQWVSPVSEHKYKLDVALHRLRTYSDCLLIFDNVEDIGDIKDYLPEPQAEPHILITSRTEQPGFTPIPLDPLDEDLSLKLLIQEAQREPEGTDEQEAARNIADRLGGLPLALELAGAFLRYRRISWKQYHDYLQQNLKDALAGKVFASFTQHEADLYSTLKIQEEVFEDEPRLRDILDLLTWSGTASMGVSLLSVLLNVPNSAELTGALSLGVALRLLQETSGEERYAIHRLVGEVRREEILLNKRLDWVNDVCERLGDWFKERKDDFADLPDYEVEIDHLRAWQGHALDYARKHASRLTWLQGYPPYHRGRYREVKKWVKGSQDLLSQVDDTDRILEAHLLNDYGNTLLQLGDYRKALEYHERALTIRIEMLGEHHPDTANSLNNLGSAYERLGDAEKALEYHERALTIRIEMLSEHHPDTASLLNNIGADYSGLEDYRKALEYHERALTIRIEMLGEHHPDTANSLNNIGVKYLHMGDYRKALGYHERALKIQSEMLGEHHPDTARSLSNIGNSYYELGD